MGLLIALIINTLALLITDYLINDFRIVDTQTAIVAAIVLGLLNTFIKPILLFLTAPLNLLTLGLFTFIINAIVLFMVSALVPGVIIQGWIPTIITAVVLSVISTILASISKGITK